MKNVVIDGNSLTIGDVVQVARKERQAELSPASREKMQQSRDLVEEYVENEKVVYGITTGFGKFANVVISKADAARLQRNLIISHACGVGEEFPAEVVRAMMLLRANDLAKGHSGIRVSTVETLLRMLNTGVIPVIPQKGSLGASGDLAPLAHMVLVLIGEGEADFGGKRLSGRAALAAAGIEPVELREKEGLALINGTQVMSAVGSLAVHDAAILGKAMDIIAALTVEGLRGVTDAFDHRVHAIRPQPGQIKCAANLLNLLADSRLVTRQGELRVQDAYALRCIPQVHGASKDALAYVQGVIETEINAATDNPLIFPAEGDVISGGNFHGQPLALALDFLGIAVAEMANISERRIERLVNHQLNDLPAFLVGGEGGVNSGFMIAQYCAASLVSENKVLAHPASVDSIPSSANQEDHVSMGTIAARKARIIVQNAASVLGIEYLAAAQAVSLRDGVDHLGRGTVPAYRLLREQVAPLEGDRVMYPDIQAATDLVRSGRLLELVEAVVGELN